MNVSKNILGFALLASVAINLLILGAAGGITVASLRHQAPPPPMARPLMPQSFKFNPKRFVRALPKAERQRAIQVLKEASGKHRRISRSIRKTNKELAILLTAEELDNIKIEETFKHLRVLDAEAQKLGQSIILRILQDLDPQTRNRVIRAASQHPPMSQRDQRNKQRRRQRPPEPLH
ncbi:MAG: hypothetical protein COA85_00485 [Robiginitomaculum sp.]|nr:MAG: hypothetical protein COA85_00485 [Robiginitomaculum sp.]